MKQKLAELDFDDAKGMYNLRANSVAKIAKTHTFAESCIILELLLGPLPPI